VYQSNQHGFFFFLDNVFLIKHQLRFLQQKCREYGKMPNQTGNWQLAKEVENICSY